MFEFILANISTIVISIVLILFIVFAVRKIIKDKKDGVGPCGTKCSECPKSNSCPNAKNNPADYK